MTQPTEKESGPRDPNEGMMFVAVTYVGLMGSLFLGGAIIQLRKSKSWRKLFDLTNKFFHNL